MTANDKSPPVLKNHVGNVHYAIWKQTHEGKNFYKATFEIRYKKGEEWKSTHSYGTRELEHLWKANVLAHSAILKFRSEDNQAAADDVEDEADAA